MKTALFSSLLALTSSTAFASPLAIEPSLAFSEAVKVAVDAARAQLGDSELQLEGKVILQRGKSEMNKFGDFDAEITLDKFGDRVREAHCTVAVFISREVVAKRSGDVVVLETDADANLQTIASNVRVRCN